MRGSMQKPRDKKYITLSDLAQRLGCPFEGDPQTQIYGFSSLEKAHKGDLVFLAHSKYRNLLEKTQASAAIIPEQEQCERIPVIKSSNPQKSFFKAVEYFFKPYRPPAGINPRAVVSPEAKLGKDVSIGALAVVGDGAEIGDETVIFPGAIIYPRVKIGRQCVIHSKVSIREEVRIGNRVVVHNGSVIGSDGFGYTQTEEGHRRKIPQPGTVVIHDDVEIGANSTVDRATLGETAIGRGTKIDNLVQVAHNVEIGPHCVLAAQTGIAGSTKVGQKVITGGQAGIADHLKIGDHAVIAAKSGVISDVPENTMVAGYPHMNIKEWRQTWASVRHTRELIRELRKLKKRVEELKKQKS
ncbi:UDP-3-O-(3-hydroxymyristoyl)glucosamine N-acyltransferase [bacterium]|nr:UDP-3-O-(3-hydroxymyristoyl)glucosamine N-acyltransferase [bacterium]